MSTSPPFAPAWTAAALADLEAAATGLGCAVRRDEPLARHTSMGVGGPCPVMIWPQHADHVRALAGWMGERHLVWRVLGGGSNLLVAGAGVVEPVLNTGHLARGDTYGPDEVRLPAGMPMARALRQTVRRGLEGLVWAAGLPGTVGGAAAGNAGCWGGEMASVVVRLEIVDGLGRSAVRSGDELAYAYRELAWPASLPGPVTIVAVVVRVHEDDPAALSSRYLELQARKRERQPVGERNSGCIFRNPAAGPTAGELIERAGCKGLRVGGAVVSGVHANFVVNARSATDDEVLRLVARVRERVHEASGVELEMEIRRW